MVNFADSRRSVYVSLVLTCPTNSAIIDACLRVRLIVSRESGAGEIYSLFQSKGSVPWGVGEEPLHFKSVPSPIEGGLFVIDSKTGKPLTAERSKLPSVYSGLQVPEISTGQTACLLISVGLKGARMFSNLIGDRVSKVDWNHRESSAQVAQVVERMGSHALIVQTGASHVALYSLPLLEHVDTAQTPTASPLYVFEDLLMHYSHSLLDLCLSMRVVIS